MNQVTQRGASLVEVMVALFVLAIGLLGMLALQTKSMQFNQSAYSYSQAVFLASDLAERIRTNPDRAVNYVVADDATVPEFSCRGINASCTAEEVVAHDLFHWKENVGKALPLGEGAVESVTLDGRDFLRITVSFDDSRSVVTDGTDGAEIEPRKSYILMMEI